MTDNELRRLKIRRSMARAAIQTLDKITPAELEGLGFDEETRQDALNEYKNQLAVIDAKIAVLTGTPPPVIVGLKTAVMDLHLT